MAEDPDTKDEFNDIDGASSTEDESNEPVACSEKSASELFAKVECSPAPVTDNNASAHKKYPMEEQSLVKKDKESILRKMAVFIFHSGTPSQCIRNLLFGCILLAIGVIGFFKFRTAVLGLIPIVPTLITLGIAFLTFSIVLSILHMFIVFCHGRRIFYNRDFIHYLSELEVYVAIMFCISLEIGALSFANIQAFADRWIFYSVDFRYLTVKTSLGVFLATALLAIKSHYMNGLAVSFNYSNYRDRIQESLFGDRILNLLQKSRHTFKFRQKLRGREDQHHNVTNTLRRHRSHSPNGLLANVKNRNVLKSECIQDSRSVRDVQEITSPSPSPSQSQYGNLNFVNVSHFLESPSSSAISQSPPSFSSTPLNPSRHPPSAPSRSVAIYLTESDKKRQFNEFFRLANQITSRFSNVADYRVELAEEAKRLSTKLYKYLRQEDRPYLLGQDFLPYIEDQSEFRRAVALVKRYAENSATSQTLSMEEASIFAFGQAELQRAVDGILTELYVTAKSLQTIETALGKVDSFFTLLVALMMIIIAAILMGDAVKLLLALSTVLSGAAFAFGTSAKNMFESMIFLLVIHPFDVGDRVFIPLCTTTNSMATTFATMAGVDALDNLVVSEMHLLSTIFERWDGVKLYVPNYVLAAKAIFNIRRSGPLLEIQRIHVDFTTPISKIDEFRSRLDEFVRKEQADYTDISRVVIDSIENCNRINLNVVYQHSTNWQEMDGQLARRSKILSFIKDTLDSLDITYLPPLQRVALVPAGFSPSLEGINLLSSGEAQHLLRVAKNHKLPV